MSEHITAEPLPELVDVVERHEQHPDTFQIPTSAEIDALRPDDLVKLMWELPDGQGERMWVVLTSVGPERFEGRLDNEPFIVTGLEVDQMVRFGRRNIASIWSDED